MYQANTASSAFHETSSGSLAMDSDSCPCEDCQQSASSKRIVRWGDIVTVDLEMTPENGLVPEPLFDRDGIITFVVGWGNYLPALHEMVQGKGAGESFENISIDAGWGDRNPDLVMELPKSKLQRFLQADGNLPKVGSILKLSGGIQLAVLKTDEEKETSVVDANPPLAGASYKCSLKILEINDVPVDAIQQGTHQQQSSQTRYKTATFALGCFWGGELAFLRETGVVGTRVGYTQGTVSDPSYEEVCTGKTQHREAIMVIYDPQVVSYQQLMGVAVERLAATKTMNNNSSSSSSSMFGNMFDEEDEEPTSTNQQYHHGYYYHSEDQRRIAEAALNESNPYDIELKKAAVFYDAEESHQQYLLKGGQSARKGAKETIRCYG